MRRLFGLVALAILIIGGIAVVPPSQKIPAQQQTERTSTAKNKPDAMKAKILQSHEKQSDAGSVLDWLIRFFEVKLTDILIVFFTAVLAYKTSGLFKETAGLRAAADQQALDMKASIAAGQKAADAADQSARAAIAIELPIIRIAPEPIGTSEKRDGDKMIVSYWVPGLIFSNLGRTKAFPIEIKCGMTCGQELPSEPHYSTSDSFALNHIFEPDRGATPRKNLSDCSVIIPEGDGDRIYKGTLGLWFYCCLVYDDFMQTSHEAAFCWKWTNIGGGLAWRADGTPTYNRKT